MSLGNLLSEFEKRKKCRSAAQSTQADHALFLCCKDSIFTLVSTVMILSFWTDRSEQTVQTQIRILLEEQSDQGFHCLLFHSRTIRFGLFS